MNKYLTTFPLQTGKKKRLITTYRGDENGNYLRNKHEADLQLLEANYPIDTNYAFAYLKNQSIRILVSKHLDNCYFYQFDISNFFASINHQILLDKLATTEADWNLQLINECSNNKPIGLALGLVPSPYLSNIYLADFDQVLISELKSIDNSIVYTRYSDDLTISASNQLDQELLLELLTKLLANVGLTINSSKSKSFKLDTKGQHIKVLGLNIIRGQQSNYVTVGRKFKTNMAHERNPQRKQAMDSYIRYNEM